MTDFDLGGFPCLTLRELNLKVKAAIRDANIHEVWVTGELAEGRTAQNGHFYGELIEKDEFTDQVVARARVTCWSSQWREVHDYFVEQTGQELRQGMKLMLMVSPQFHEQYGFSLQIIGIQPQFTLGGQALKRRQILMQLASDGILEDNQQLHLPTLTQRIAVVSAQNAAGWGDFRDQLLNNPQHLRFRVQLFPAVMQGQHVEESVIAALEAIADQWEEWDAVVIIRGGGASTDLSDFDSYPLAACIAQFPLPVITGIGHERDETVLDHVAHTHLKTPTAVAAFLVERMAAQLERLNNLAEAIPQLARIGLERHQNRLDALRQRLSAAVQNQLTRQHSQLDLLAHRLPAAVQTQLQRRTEQIERLTMRLDFASRQTLERNVHRFQLISQRLKALDPMLPLQRGYSMVRIDGKIVAGTSRLQPGMEIEIMMKDGTIDATIHNISRKEK